MHMCVSTLVGGQAVPSVPPEGSLRDTDTGFQVITVSTGPPSFLCLKGLEVQGVKTKVECFSPLFHACRDTVSLCYLLHWG